MQKLTLRIEDTDLAGNIVCVQMDIPPDELAHRPALALETAYERLCDQMRHEIAAARESGLPWQLRRQENGFAPFLFHDTQRAHMVRYPEPGNPSSVLWLYYWHEGQKGFVTLRKLTLGEETQFRLQAMPDADALLYFQQ